LADLRIRIAKDKAELVKSLVVAADNNSPFQTYADVVLFAAVLGAKFDRRAPLGEISRKEPGPIDRDIFSGRGYDPAIFIIAIAATQNLNIISPHQPDFEQQRFHILEEYANGGLEILERELRGAVDYTERILLMLSSSIDPTVGTGTGSGGDTGDREFDLSRFLS
jgi:dnd system-associated protein 4